MSDWTSYRLSDFILFSEAIYYRQFELYNQAIWPLHIVAILFALSVLYALCKRPVWVGRIVASVLVVSWLWVAVAFLYSWFYQIHVVANWYAFGFILQAGLVCWFGFIKNRFNELVTSRLRINVGSGLLFVAIFLYPFIAWMSGRSWLQFEMFALAPDPTVLATIAILVLLKVPRGLYVIPALWILISVITLSVM